MASLPWWVCPAGQPCSNSTSGSYRSSAGVQVATVMRGECRASPSPRSPATSPTPTARRLRGPRLRVAYSRPHRDPAVADRDRRAAKVRPVSTPLSLARPQGPDDRDHVFVPCVDQLGSFDPEVVEGCRASPARRRAECLLSRDGARIIHGRPRLPGTSTVVGQRTQTRRPGRHG